MTLPAIFALAGCVALLIGLLGGGIKAKEVEVPTISMRTRIIAAGIGAILIGVSLWLFLADSQITTGETNPTAVSNPTSLATVSEDHAPILKFVTIREEKVKNNLVIYQDVSYSDAEGDAETIDWILVTSTSPEAAVTDGTLDDSVEEQKQGAVFTGVWNCLGEVYSATIRIILIDKAGNQSEPLEYNLECH